MGEPTEDERDRRRKLAANITSAALAGEPIPVDIDIVTDEPVEVVQLADAMAIIVELAQEVVALQEDDQNRLHRIGDFLVRQSGTVTVDVRELRRIYSLGVEYGAQHGAVLDGDMVISRAGMKKLVAALSRAEMARRVKAAIEKSLPWLERESHNINVDSTTDAVVDALEQPERKPLRDRLFRVLADVNLAAWDNEEFLDRLTAAALDEPPPMGVNVKRHLPIGMAHSLDRAEIAALRALRLAGLDLVARTTLERDPHARLMFAYVRGNARVGGRQLVGVPAMEPVEIGELACVEVPTNCSIHDADAQRMAMTLTLADMIGKHWREQEGVNADLLDQLASVTDTSFVTNTIKEG